METKLTREELYRLVWATPMRKLAKEFGLSDVGLAKVCKRHNIPRPSLGYWAKVEAGQKPPVLKLPASGRDASEEYICIRGSSTVVDRTEGESGSQLELKRVYQEWLANTQKPIPRVVEETRLSLSRAKPDERRLVSPGLKTSLDVEICPPSLDRSMSVMEAVIGVLELAGHQIKVSSKGSPRHTTATVNGESIAFQLREAVKRFEVEAKPKKRPNRGEFFWFTPTEYRYEPSGRLKFTITSYRHRGSRKSWSDGKVQRLEELIPRMVEGVISAAQEVKDKREADAIRQKQWEERRRQEELLAEQRRQYKKRVLRMSEEVALWHEAERIRAYARAAGQSHCTDHETPLERREWVSWMLGYADRLDPLMPAGSLSSDLFPKHFPWSTLRDGYY